MINNNLCSMKYTISEAVRLWLCIGCGCNTTLPAKKKHHFPQMASLLPLSPKYWLGVVVLYFGRRHYHFVDAKTERHKIA